MRNSASLAAWIPVASWIALDPGGWYPFGPAKWASTTFVALAALTILLAGRSVAVPKAAGALWLVFITLVVASTLTALDPRLAWIGTAERHLGLLAWCVFAGCFVVGANVAAAEDLDGHANGGVARVSRGVVLATSLAGAYTMVELLFGAPVTIESTTQRLGGPFGSAAYLGAAMCVAVPVCTGVAVDVDTPRPWRALAVGAAALGVMAAAGSGTRGAWLGLAVATLVVLPRCWQTQWRLRIAGHGSSSTTHRRSALVLAVAALAAVALIAPRLADVVERAAPASSRMDEWRVAARVIAERPLLGAGPEGYRLVVGEGVDERYERTYGRDVAPDRAHSGPLDVAAVAGIPTAMVYLALLALIAAAAVRAVWRGRPLMVGLGAGLLAYMVQQLVLFPIAEIDAVFWLLAGLLIGASGAPASTLSLPRLGRAPMAAIAGGTAAACIFAVGIAGVAADRLARHAVTTDDAPGAIDAAERSVALRPDVVRGRLLLADLHAGTATLAGIDDAIDATAGALEWSPRDPIVRRYHAIYLSLRAEITGAPTDADTALDAWERLTDDDPHCYRCQIGLGAAAALAGQVEKARSAWAAATRLTDDVLPHQLLAELDRVGAP